MSQLWITVLVTLGVALLLSLLATALAVLVRPDVLRLTERCVCGSGLRMVVQASDAGARRTVTCLGDPRSVVGRAFVWLWTLVFAVTLPVGAFLAVVTCSCL